jgi:hypothetical protein
MATTAATTEEIARPTGCLLNGNPSSIHSVALGDCLAAIDFCLGKPLRPERQDHE